MKQKKILIVSASIGTGHMQAAKAIQEYYQLMEPEAIVTHEDFLSENIFSIDYFVKETYIKLLDIFPLFYELLYRLSQRERQGDIIQTVVSWMLKNRMLKLIKKEEPDVLVFTHPFPCGAACILKRQKLIQTPIVGVITDFTVHQFWVYSQVDRYCVGSDTLIKSLTKCGIDPKKIIVTGMPIRRAYYDRPKRDYKANLERTALVMGGGLGLGAISKVLNELNHTKGIDAITVVAGHNEALYENLLEMKKDMVKPVEVYAYTTKIPELMKKASMLFTKPGGVTCQEAVSLGLPMIFYSAIPGQEEENASLFEELHCARWIKNLNDLSDEVEQLLVDPTTLQSMSDASEAWNEDGAVNIGCVIHSLLEKERREEVKAVMADTIKL